MSYNEFEIIKRFFERKTNSCYEVEKGIGDDCALINIPEKQTITISTDTLVANVHFLLSISPADLAYKALAINLSDLAAMGSNPAWLTLAITLPDINENWLTEFSNSLFEQINYHNIQLIGGDTTCGPLSITISIYGLVPLGCAIRRSGAKRGDWIFVTGTLGGSAAGLSLLQHQHYVQDPIAYKMLVQRHLRPIPRLQQGQALRNLATSAIDISDGLISDISHVLDDSHVGACLYLESLPILPQLYNYFDPRQVLSWALSGGEDYELCFTVPEVNLNMVDVLLGNFDVPYTCIGKITSEEEGLVLLKNGKSISLSIYKGFDHFGKKYS